MVARFGADTVTNGSCGVKNVPAFVASPTAPWVLVACAMKRMSASFAALWRELSGTDLNQRVASSGS